MLEILSIYFRTLMPVSNYDNNRLWKRSALIENFIRGNVNPTSEVRVIGISFHYNSQCGELMFLNNIAKVRLESCLRALAAISLLTQLAQKTVFYRFAIVILVLDEPSVLFGGPNWTFLQLKLYCRESRLLLGHLVLSIIPERLFAIGISKSVEIPVLFDIF